MWKAAEHDEIVEIQIMAGIDAKAKFMRKPRGARVRGKRLACLRLERARERFGVQLDAGGPYICRPPDRRFFWIDEHAHANPIVMEVRDEATKQVVRRVGRPSGLTRNLSRMNRHERALIWLHRVHELQQIRPGVAFDIELDAPLHRPQVCRDVVHIRRRDMPRIGTRMYGDSRRARVDADLDGLEHGRNGPAS